MTAWGRQQWQQGGTPLSANASANSRLTALLHAGAAAEDLARQLGVAVDDSLALAVAATAAHHAVTSAPPGAFTSMVLPGRSPGQRVVEVTPDFGSPEAIGAVAALLSNPHVPIVHRWGGRSYELRVPVSSRSSCTGRG